MLNWYRIILNEYLPNPAGESAERLECTRFPHGKYKERNTEANGSQQIPFASMFYRFASRFLYHLLGASFHPEQHPVRQD